MRKFLLLALFLVYGIDVFSAPGRLQGFSYARDEKGVIKIKEETVEFNQKPVQYDEEPKLPHYLNDDLSDARTGVSQSGDKYKLTPVYSVQDLYNRQNDYKTGKIEDENYDASDDKDSDETEE